MKHRIIILLILTMFLSGCGIYNLNNFTLPDDNDFLALIQGLDIPEKICEYMTDNFTYKKIISYNITPYNLYITKEGDCGDFANFVQFIADYHNYTTYSILIYFKGTTEYHALAVFVENGKYTYSNNRFYHPLFALDFNEIVLDFFTYCNHEYKSYKVYDYELNLIEECSRWQ